MITRREDVPEKVVTGLHGGRGELHSRNFLSQEDSNGMGRVFSVSTLEAGGLVAWHEHHGDSELFYILRGEPLVLDENKEEHRLKPGDVMLCRDGEGHSIEAVSGPVDYISIILFTEQQKG